MSFAYAYSEIWSSLLNGGTLIPVGSEEVKDINRIYHILQKYNVTVLHYTPQAFYRLMEEDKKHKLRINTLILAGESPNLQFLGEWLVRYPHTNLINLYGFSESVGNIATYLVKKGDTKVLIGKPMPDVTIRLLDENLNSVKEGDVGEICIISKRLSLGYFQHPDWTVEKFIADPWGNSNRLYKTGDLGRFCADGNIEYVGRVDNQINVHGFRVEVGEIKRILDSNKNISANITLSKTREDGSKYFVAYIMFNKIRGQYKKVQSVVSQSGIEIHTLSGKNIGKLIEDIIASLEAEIPSYMIPNYFVVVDRMPLVPNGKVDRLVLLELRQYNIYGDDSVPKNEIELKLCEICKELLHLDKVRLNDNFFRIGGDSITAIKVVGLINYNFLSELKVVDFFKQKTIKGIAKIIEKTHAKSKYKKYMINGIDYSKLFAPFPLTNLQQAYYLGRYGSFEIGNVCTHGYTEYVFDSLDIEKLEQSLNYLIKRHHSLRIFLKNGYQRFLQDAPHYKIKVTELKSEKQLKRIRDEYSHKVYNPEEYPLFDIFVSKLKNKYILHVSVDILSIDSHSYEIFNREWSLLYNNFQTELPVLQITYRDYLEKYTEVKKSQLFNNAREYWEGKIDDYNFDMNLPYAVNGYFIEKPHFSRVTKVISKSKWDKIVQKAIDAGVSFTAVLVTVFGEVLRHWTSQERVCINMTQFNRLPLHPQIDNIIGDFTVVELFNYKEETTSVNLQELFKNVHTQLWQDWKHSLYDGIDFQRFIKRQNRFSNDKIIAPIVLTSILGIKMSDRQPGFLDKSFQRIGYSITQTSQVYLDNKAFETEEGFVAEWDYVEQLFDRETMELMHSMYCSLVEFLSDADWSVQKFPELCPAIEDMKLIEKANSYEQAEDKGTIVSKFEAAADEHCDLIAIVDDDGKYAYKRLKSDAIKVASQLLNRSIKEPLIGVLIEKGYQQAVSILSIMKSGHAFLPFNVDWPEGRVHEILETSGTNTVLTTKSQEKKLSPRIKKKYNFLMV
jgi:non-ribosomal peptide synthetase component F/acyl carrier protein